MKNGDSSFLISNGNFVVVSAFQSGTKPYAAEPATDGLR